MLSLHDQETSDHCQRVANLTVRLAHEMGLDGFELIFAFMGALLHDIGKLRIPISILRKPGPLSEEEWKVMRLHPVYAGEMLMKIPYLRPALDIPYYHHERWNGTGYPYGLKARQIPLTARIFAVVDVWDALRADRDYRPAWPAERVSGYIFSQAGKFFDPEVVETFLTLPNLL